MRAPVVLTTSFAPQDASFINATGRAKVSGQAFLRMNDGKMFRAVGTDVFLIPKTTYAAEWVGAIFGDEKGSSRRLQMPGTDTAFGQYMRRTIATSGGSFSFDGVADGEYYVVAMLHLPNDVMLYEFPIMERVTVRGGKSVRLVMRGY